MGLLNDIHKEVTADYMNNPMVRDFKESDFNRFVAVGFLMYPPERILIGRIVQVRCEAGAWGSHTVLLRNYDGSLQSHENQHFHFVPEKHFDALEDIFKEGYLDEPNITYSILNQDEQTGFIIPSTVPDGQSTPLRDVHNALMERISEKISQANP